MTHAMHRTVLSSIYLGILAIAGACGGDDTDTGAESTPTSTVDDGTSAGPTTADDGADDLTDTGTLDDGASSSAGDTSGTSPGTSSEGDTSGSSGPDSSTGPTSDTDTTDCEAMGGMCMTSQIDPGFAPSCEREFGLESLPGACPAINEACCGEPL
jgi:hypothetical protein